MNEILKLTNELNNLILNSEEYINYKNAKNNLQKDNQLYKQMQAFRKLQIEGRYNELHDINSDFNNEKYLTKLYSDLIISDVANSFFETELILINLLDNINSVIEKNIEIDFFELN